MKSVCPSNVAMHSPVIKSHCLIVLSQEPVHKCDFVATTLVTGPLWPLNNLTVFEVYIIFQM